MKNKFNSITGKAENMKKFLRHGDVNLHEVDISKMDMSKMKRVERDGKYILARGEATGSVHEVSTVNPDNLEVYQNEDGTVYVRVLEPAEITHTHDHETIILEPGTYKQVPEREVDHFSMSTIRKVVD